MISIKKNKSNIVALVFLALFLFEAFTNSTTSTLAKVLYIAMIISLVGAEIIDRRKNSKISRITDSEPVLSTKDSDYYLSMVIFLVIINAYAAICTFGNGNLDGIAIFKGNITIMIGLVLLLIGYGYFYFSSSQDLYKNGIKLMNNAFIHKKDIVQVTHRNTIIKKRKLIEITCKNQAIGFSNTVRIKCKNNDDFNKAIKIFKNNMGIAPKVI